MGLYLKKVGDEANKILDGAVFYGTPWSPKDGHQYFYSVGFGYFQKVIGLHLNNLIKTEQMPKMKKYLSKEDFEYYMDVLENNKTGLDTLDFKIYVKMFGYKDWVDYYEQCSMGDEVGKI